VRVLLVELARENHAGIIAPLQILVPDLCARAKEYSSLGRISAAEFGHRSTDCERKDKEQVGDDCDDAMYGSDNGDEAC
jgi:hypothetical protein